jgi:hypothetical protein
VPANDPASPARRRSAGALRIIEHRSEAKAPRRPRATRCARQIDPRSLPARCDPRLEHDEHRQHRDPRDARPACCRRTCGPRRSCIDPPVFAASREAGNSQSQSNGGGSHRVMTCHICQSAFLHHLAASRHPACIEHMTIRHAKAGYLATTSTRRNSLVAARPHRSIAPHRTVAIFHHITRHAHHATRAFDRATIRDGSSLLAINEHIVVRE